MGEVVKGFNGGCLEDTHHLTYALVLGDLHTGEEALLINTYIPHLSTIGQHRDNEHIVYMAPV